MSELLSCPFCGTSGAHEKYCYINLYFESEVLGEDIPWEVMANAWNTRAERTCTLEQVEGWTGGTSYAVKCSSCGKMSDSSEFDFEYCPQCGARVEGD